MGTGEHTRQAAWCFSIWRGPILGILRLPSLGTILRAINGLALFPLMGKPGEVPETRERLITHYPYRIVYYINQHAQVIEVWRVMHTALQWPPADTME